MMMTEYDIDKCLESGKKTRYLEGKVRFDDLICKLAKEFCEKLKEKEIRLCISSDKELSICFNEEITTMMLRSLLHTTIEITSKGGTIEISYFMNQEGEFVFNIDNYNTSLFSRKLDEDKFQFIRILVEKMGGDFCVGNIGDCSKRVFFTLPTNN
jgi:hypothetical protein